MAVEDDRDLLAAPSESLHLAFNANVAFSELRVRSDRIQPPPVALQPEARAALTSTRGSADLTRLHMHGLFRADPPFETLAVARGAQASTRKEGVRRSVWSDDAPVIGRR